MKKTFKRTSAFVCAMAVMAAPMTFSSFVANADGETVTSDYTLTIPATLAVENSGWNSIGNLTATGTLAQGKKLNVTATSKNSWNLTSDANTVAYKLCGDTEKEKTYAEATDTTSLDISKESLEQTSGFSVPIGIVVEDYSEKPAGDYSDTVTFTAKVENAVTTRTVTFNTDTDGKTINKDGVTCSRGFDTYNNLFGDGSGFSVSSGQFTKIEVTADDTYMTGTDQMTMNTIEGWSTTSTSTATWTGKSSTVPFGVIMGNRNPVTIVFTIEE